MKVAISLPDSLFASTEHAAKDMGLSRSALIQQALEAFLEARAQKTLIEKLNRVYAKSDSSVPEAIQIYQSARAQSEEW